MIEYTVRVYEDRTEWYLNGKLHREDGPAVEYSNGSKRWYLNDQQYTEQEFNHMIQVLGYEVKNR